jgi:YD repeat-containing protein
MKNIKTLNNKSLTMERRGYLIGIIIVSLLFLIPFISSVNEFDEYKPYLHQPSVGDVPELRTFGTYKSVLFTGAGSYFYSIEVPAGTNGLQPSVYLSYSSQSATQRPGKLGAGWSLNENYIMRDINHTANDTSDDYYIISLDQLNLRFYYDGAIFNAEINPNQIRIQNFSNSGEEYWIITGTDGTQYRFGYKNSSIMESNTGFDYRLKWYLDQVSDVYGNKIFYGYEKNPNAEDSGAIYLNNITYNNDELRLIEFSYETSARPDRRLSYEQGNLVEESRRLDNIEVSYDGSLVRRYDFGYELLNNEGSMSSIVNISYVGSSGTAVLNTVKFDYYNSTSGFDDTTGNWLVPGSYAFSSGDVTGKDFGVRLIDVNNDGFVDLVKASSIERITQINNKTDGWSITGEFVIPSGIEFVDSNGVDQGVRFADFNSDGLIDFVKAKGGEGISVYINNGSSWSESTNYSFPLSVIKNDSKDLGVNLVDLNNDGRVDILKAYEGNESVAYINNGSGWENNSDWVVPNSEYFVDTENKDTGLRIIDLNNDGLPDLIKGGIPGQAWLNTGNGWSNYSQYAPNLEFTDSEDRPDLGVRFMELNGDGLIDLVQNFYSNVSIINETCVSGGNSTEECIIGQNITFDTNTKLNTGVGWVAGGEEWNVPERFTDEGYNIGRRIADVNGDGYSDIVVAYQNASFENITHIRDGSGAFLLKSVTGPYGGVTEISYEQSTLSDNGQQLGFNLWLVGNTSLNNAVPGEFNADSDYSYLYFEGKFDYSATEFRGFGIVNETLPDNSIRTHLFHQDETLKGKEYETQIYGISGEKLRDEFNVFETLGDKTINLIENSIKIYDGEVTPSTINTTFEYDLYGNIKKVNSFGNIDLSGDEKFEEYNYYYNETSFIVNKVSNYTLFDYDGSTIVRQDLFYYDGLGSGVVNGSLTKNVRYNNAGPNPEYEYAYDGFGNVISQTDPLDYVTNYTYETTGAYLISQVNPLGHSVNYTYDLDTGNILSETRDGLIKEYEYDEFGRILKEIISPDDSTYPTKRYTYDLNGTAPESIKVENKNNQSSYMETIYFYDGIGNLLQSKTLTEDSNQIVKNYFYDSKYRISQEENPYLVSYSTNLENSQNSSMINYGYDSLDRVVNVTDQIGNSISILFDRDLVSQIDENGNKIDYILDGQGRIIIVVEHNATSIGEEYNTTYIYFGDDNLEEIVDVQSNSFLFDYDTLGRRKSFDDPNMNPWTYVYDLNGNLINQTDGRGVNVTMEYDPINRITRKLTIGGKTNVTFAYDQQHDGTLSNISLEALNFKPIYYSYEYDDRLRISKEVLSIHIKENVPGGREWLNTSVDYDSQDRIIQMYLPNDNLTYGYNELGKLDSINGFLSSINYNNFGKISSKTYTNSLVTDMNYDNLARISNIIAGSVQNLSYTYDKTGNVKSINDSVNSMTHDMEYDNLNRLTRTKIWDFVDQDHNVFSYEYDSISNLLSATSNDRTINYTYGTLAHAPTMVISNESLPPRIEINQISPENNLTVNAGDTFSYTSEFCCRDNNCGGILASLDPEEMSYTPNTETICESGKCTKIIYSDTRFAYEDNQWKNIEEAISLKDVWNIEIDKDPNFIVDVYDYNYTTITIDIKVSNDKLRRNVPLRIYDKNRNGGFFEDLFGLGIDEKQEYRFEDEKDAKRVVLTVGEDESLLQKEIKWGDASTIITVYDPNAVNLGDSYIRDGGFVNENYGSEDSMRLRNSSSSNEHILIQFNLSNIPSYAIVEEARLHLYLDVNGLNTGQNYDITSHEVYSHYSWDEATVTWNFGPNSTDYNLTPTDSVNVFGGSGEPSAEYLSWDVTSIVSRKNSDESFYIYPSNSSGATPTTDLTISSKENPGATKRPYLNVTYYIKNLIPENSSAMPFYTTTTNPYPLELEKDECEQVTWNVNASGTDSREYIFYSFANKTSDQSIMIMGSLVNITVNGTSEPIVLPNDTHKFLIKNSSSDTVAWLGDGGNIVLRGSCFSGGSCDSPGSGGNFIIQNSDSQNVAFINSTGDLCVESGDCSDLSGSCNPGTGAFIIRNSGGTNVSYIDYNGDLCLTGGLYENSEL